ncbi:hypothetical protein GOBAR_DD23005 [Gossypium barbadense]|nr:hypothetical protein GOBAR_DD23005 [Gossypium barbadense]
MELVDDEDVETMVDLYYGNGSQKNAPIHLFAELVSMEQNEDVNASDEEDWAEEPRMVAPISYVDSESTIGGMGIDLNITPDVDMIGGEEECAAEEEGGGDHWDEEVDSDANPDVDDVPDGIDDEDVNNDKGINVSSVGEQMRRIVIHNNPRPHMSLIDPDAAYVVEFSKYPEIVHSHGLAVTSDDDELFIGQRFSCKEECVYAIKRPHMSLIDPDAAYVVEFSKYPEIVHSHGLAVTSDDDELFIGQRFSCKEECVYAIKRYSMKISVDYKVSVSTLTIYVGEYWKAAEGCNWRVRAAFIRSSQMWEIQKFVGPHTCTSTRMTEDHRKLDSKTNSYELEPHIFRQRMIRLESDMEGQTNTSFRQWLRTMEPWQWAQSFDEGFRYGHMTTKLVEGINAVLLKTRHLPIASVFSATFYRLATLMPRMGQQQVDQIQAGHVFVEHVRDAMVVNRWSYGVDLWNRRCECRNFETFHYPCAHVMAACAKVNLDAEQYVDDVYTLERTLCVWENEFPVLPDLSTWEVPPITFELVPDRGLRRNPRGRRGQAESVMRWTLGRNLTESVMEYAG